MDYVQAIEIFFAVTLLIAVVYLMIKRKSNVTFSIIWIAVALIAVIQGVFPQILDYICRVLGIDYPPTLIMVAAIALLFVIVVYMTSELTVAQNKLREQAIHISLLNDEMYKLKREKEGVDVENPLSEQHPDVNDMNVEIH